MWCELLSANILAVFVNLITIQNLDTIPQSMKPFDHSVVFWHKEVSFRPARRLSIGRKSSIGNHTYSTLKQRCIPEKENIEQYSTKLSCLKEIEDATNDSKKIKGSWAVVTLIRNGVGDETLINPEDSILRFYISSDKITFFDIVHGGIDKGSFKLDPTTRPKSIDLTFHSSEGKKNEEAIRGIYKFDGDALIICYRLHEWERPSEFKSKAGSENFLFILKQLKQ